MSETLFEQRRFSKFRNDFPMLRKTMHGKPLVYLDSAATAQKPQAVIDAVREFYESHYGTVHRAVYELSTSSTENYQHAREVCRRFINAGSVHEVLFTRGTTESINLVASSFGKAFITPGDEVVITEMEHHSNLVPWQMLCEERQALLKVVPVQDNGELDLEAYQSLLSERTKLVAVGHVSNTLGTVNPLEKIIPLAHRTGAKVLVDGAQAAPHLPIDVRELNADFYVFSGHKAFGPTGIGILFGKEELLEKMPPYQGGGDMIKTVTLEKTTYNDLPLKFEAGTPMIAEVMGMRAALEYLMEIGMQEVHDYEQHLLKRAASQLEAIEGLRVVGTAPDKGAIISFIVEGIHHLDIGTLLDLQGIAVRTGHHCTQPLMQRYQIPGTVRASFALYNTMDEADRFAETLKNVIKKLR